MGTHSLSSLAARMLTVLLIILVILLQGFSEGFFHSSNLIHFRFTQFLGTEIFNHTILFVNTVQPCQFLIFVLVLAVKDLYDPYVFSI